MTQISPRAIDLFSGCGGLSKGLIDAGFEVLGAIELDPVAAQTYADNHAHVEMWIEDIRSVSVESVLKRLELRPGELDLLAACPPCQGYSALRTLNGAVEINDPRNELLHEVLRMAKGLQPKAILMENVPGLKDAGEFKRFDSSLHQSGYRSNYRILNAADFGVPQRRRRLIYVAGKGKQLKIDAAPISPLTVREAIGSLPKSGSSGDAIHDLPERRTEKIAELIRQIPHDGGSRMDLPEEDQLECHQRCDGFKDIYGRMAWDKVSPTITSGCFNPSKGRFLHPNENRAITLREAAMLQGFPLDYKFQATTSKTYLAQMIGNALPPPFVTAQAKAIRPQLEQISTADQSATTSV